MQCRIAVVCGHQEAFPYGLPATYVTHDTAAEADEDVAPAPPRYGGVAVVVKTGNKKLTRYSN